MKSQAELNEIYIDVDYNDAESIVKGFLMYSALNRMQEFDFDQAFNELRNPIDYKLKEHAQCSYEEFADYNSEMGLYIDDDFNKFTYCTDYINVDIDDVKEAINKLHYEKSKEAFDGLFDNLIDIVHCIDQTSDTDQFRQYNVELFDRVIHAQHVTGDIFEDIDVDDIKAELDEELIELMGIELQAA